ncbi:hypothetical protein HPP92_027645, partial [Vanilla planifolia]
VKHLAFPLSEGPFGDWTKAWSSPNDPFLHCRQRLRLMAGHRHRRLLASPPNDAFFFSIFCSCRPRHDYLGNLARFRCHIFIL